MKFFLRYYWPIILWALFVFTLCAIPLNEVSPSPIFFPGFDKLVHCGFFFVFTVLYAYGLIRQHNLVVFAYNYAITVLLIALLYGGGIEILQATVFTWRDGDWNDFFADTIGTCMGIFSVLVTSMAFRHDKK